MQFKKRSYPLISRAQFRLSAIGIPTHGSEFVADENRAPPSDTRGTVEDWAGGVPFNCSRDHKQQRQDKCEHNCSEKEVDDSLQQEPRDGWMTGGPHSKADEILPR